MRYVSTRGESPPIGFLDAVLAGLAPDGGLYVPERWPTFGPEEIAAFAGQPYAKVAATVIGKFVGDDIPAEDLREMCDEAYASFAHAAVTPLKQLASGRYLLELFHGPTLAFKDVAMQLLGRLYDYVLSRQSRTMTIICATSGDTGGAAVEAFRGRSNARIVALFPEGRISEVQRRFMTTATDNNVACVSIQGSFDDCQAIVKQAFSDDQFRHAVDLSGVNSINWARIAAQSVYFFTAAVALGAPARKVAFVVPTGNFGDAYAAYVATRMGLPIARIVAATNSNDILARAFEEAAMRAAPWPLPRARPWTSRSRPTSSACISRPSAVTASRLAGRSAPSPARACWTSRPAPTPRCASCSRARRSARPTPPRPSCRP
jgi:threonine synthase